jgi:hypothetical protein
MSDALDAARDLTRRLDPTIAPDAAAADVAAALARAEDTADRATRKEIRRALYRLAQTGVAVPAAPAVAAAPVLGPSIEAWVSGVDGRGDRLVWLVREQAGGGLLLVAADLNEPAGIRDLRTFDVTRKQLRGMRERFQTEGGLRFVAADWRAVDALVVEAQDRLAEPDRRLDYRRLRPRLTTLPPTTPAELASSRAVAPTNDEDRAALVAASATLLGEPELRTWWPRPEVAAPFLLEMREVRDSPLVLPPAQQEERLREILARASQALYPPAAMARRLEATAYVLAETGRPDPARVALAVATALRASPDTPVPIFQALTHQGLGSHLASLEGARQKERAGALVLTPGEVAKAESPSRPPRSRA